MNSKEKTKGCIPCRILEGVCERMPDSKYCKLLLVKYKGGKIDIDQLVGKLTAKFGKNVKKQGYKVQKEMGLIKEIPKGYR